MRTHPRSVARRDTRGGAWPLRANTFRWAAAPRLRDLTRARGDQGTPQIGEAGQRVAHDVAHGPQQGSDVHRLEGDASRFDGVEELDGVLLDDHELLIGVRCRLVGLARVDGQIRPHDVVMTPRIGIGLAQRDEVIRRVARLFPQLAPHGVLRRRIAQLHASPRDAHHDVTDAVAILVHQHDLRVGGERYDIHPRGVLEDVIGRNDVARPGLAAVAT